MNAWNHTAEMDHLRRRAERLLKKGQQDTSSSTASSQNDPRVERKKALYEAMRTTPKTKR